jgi:tetratricopeptide (TPR) repeat protein
VASIISFWLKLKAYFQAAAGWIARSATFGNVIALSWVIIFIVIGVLVLEELARDVVTIEPISVPKTLADNGYTPEVASRRLHDAITHYASINRAGAMMEQLNITPSDELPDFIVPKVDLSVNALVSSIRSVLHYGSGRRISGELILHDKLALHLRVDGLIVYSSGFISENPDDLLATAAPAVTEKIQPYVNAAALYRDHPEQALEKADDIIARLEESDVNVQWAYMLKGDYSYDHGNYAEAERWQRKAISLNWSNPMPHNSLGRALRRLDRLDEAITQFRRVIGINPKLPVAYNNLGLVLGEKALPNGTQEEAIAQLNRAIELDRHYALPHYNLGRSFVHQGKLDDAIVEFRHTITLDPKYVPTYIELAGVLYRQHKTDDAIAELHRAIELDPKNASAHDDLGLALSRQGKTDDAIAEYRRAIEILPDYKNAHEHLDKALQAQSAAE